MKTQAKGKEIQESLKIPLTESAGSITATPLAIVNIDTIEAAKAMSMELSAVPLKHIAIVPAFAFGGSLSPQHPEDIKRHGWLDPHAIFPLRLGLAATATSGVVRTYSVNVARPEVVLHVKQMIETLNVPVIVHGAWPTFACLASLNISMSSPPWDTKLAEQLLRNGLESKQRVQVSTLADIATARQAKDRERSALALAEVCRRHGAVHPAGLLRNQIRKLDTADIDQPWVQRVLARTVAVDAVALADLYPRMANATREHELDVHFDEVRRPVLPILHQLERRGVRVDIEAARRVHHHCRQIARHAAEQLAATYRVSRPDKLEVAARVLCETVEGRRALERMAAVAGASRTHTTAFTASTLKRAARIELPVGEWGPLEWLRTYSKFSRLAYASVGPLQVGGDGRCHAHFPAMSSCSGRICSVNPNIAGLAKIFRPLVIATEGFGIGDLDYGEQEPGIAAALFHDDTLLRLWSRGSVYVGLAKDMFRSEISAEQQRWTDDVFKNHASTAPIRRRAKGIWLSTLYGRDAWSLAQELGVPVEVAGAWVADFRRRFPRVVHGLERAGEIARSRGAARTATGFARWHDRRRGWTLHDARAYGNHVIQGTSADILCLALVAVDHAIRPLGGYILIPVYDSIVIEGPLDRFEEIMAAAKEAMIEAMRTVVPELHPKVTVNCSMPHCWNDEGRYDSVDRFLADPVFRV